MSVLNKDDVIKACANAYRTASGTTDLVPVGDLEGLISALTAGGGSGEDEIITLADSANTADMVLPIFQPLADASKYTMFIRLDSADAYCLLVAIFNVSSYNSTDMSSAWFRNKGGTFGGYNLWTSAYDLIVRAGDRYIKRVFE